MAICSKCGAQLFETSKFCPECGTPVLEVSADTNKTGDIYSASENVEEENSTAVFQGIDPSEISPDETAEILEAAAEKALEDIPEIVKIEGVDIHNEKPGEIASRKHQKQRLPRRKHPRLKSRKRKMSLKRSPKRKPPQRTIFPIWAHMLPIPPNLRKWLRKFLRRKRAARLQLL